MLKDRSLSSYYDQVALKGLQLAAADAARGVLTGSRIERVRESNASRLRTWTNMTTETHR